MTHLILAPSLRFFWSEFFNRYTPDMVKKTIINRGRAYLTDGNEVRFISSLHELRGYHGVKVFRWGYVDRYYTREAEQEIEYAERP